MVLEFYVDSVSGLELAASTNSLWISMVGILPLHVLGYDSNLHESVSGCLAREKGVLSACWLLVLLLGRELGSLCSHFTGQSHHGVKLEVYTLGIPDFFQGGTAFNPSFSYHFSKVGAGLC